jgi:HlyD family secretion protein
MRTNQCDDVMVAGSEGAGVSSHADAIAGSRLGGSLALPVVGFSSPHRQAFAIFAFLLLASLSGCTAGTPAAPKKQDAKTPAQPQVVKAERKTLHRMLEQPGAIEAFEETPMHVRVPGFVGKVHVDSGDVVKGPTFDAKGKIATPGQVLAELDVPELVEELQQKVSLVKQAEAEVEQAQASLAVADSHILTAKALVREAEAGRLRTQALFDRWDSALKQAEKLVQSKVIDEQSRDETRSQFKAAEAAKLEVEAKVLSATAHVKEDEAKRTKAAADVTAARAKVNVAQASQAQVAAMLGYATIRAPYDAVVVRRNVHTGHFLQPTGMAASPVFVVARTDTLRVFVDVPEVDALLIRDRMAVQVRIPSMKHKVFEGTVSRSSWSLDVKTRTLRVQIDLANPKGQLRPGMYAHVTFDATFADRFTLPASAIGTHGEQAFAHLVDGKTIRVVDLKLGIRDGSLVEVLQWQKKGAGATWSPITGEERFLDGDLSGLVDGQAWPPATKE